MTLAEDSRLQILATIHMPLFLFNTDETAIVWANDSALEYWEASSALELSRRELKRHLTAAVMKRLQQITRECFEHGSIVTEHWTIHPRNIAKSSDYRITAFECPSGQRLLLMQILPDNLSSDSQAAYRSSVLVNTSSMISAYGSDFRLVFCNEAARRSLPESLAFASQRLVEKGDLRIITQMLISTGRCEIKAPVHTSRGKRWHEMHVQRCINPVSARSMYVVTESDITEQRSSQQEAYRLAYTDSLTALPNRAALNMHLNDLLACLESKCFAVLFLDLDRFKVINDSLGHAAGDQLLVFVAQQLQMALGDYGLVYRIGGDEFVALATHTAEPALIEHLAKQILLAMATPMSVSGHKLRATPSIGISTYPADGNCVNTLMENADTAMYAAKAQKCGYCFYDVMMSSAITENVKDQMDLENDMVSALANGEFELYYQPRIRCGTLEVTGVEALIRWNHPHRGLISPDKFIPLAEETGQIIEIGNWVLHTAMHQQRRWHRRGLDIPMSINISPRQFYANDLLSDVSTALAQTGCQPHMIELEITESMLIRDPESVNETLHRLSTIGVRIALDDFGTGFANLDSLQKYPLDCLKIDRVFLSDRKRSMLMGTILKIGKILGVQIVAEGVETSSQIDWLTRNGCNQMQGYFFSKPLPVRQITQYLYDNGAPRKDMSNAA